MFKTKRVIIAACVAAVLFLVFRSEGLSSSVKGQIYSIFQWPFSITQKISQGVVDIYYFRKNAEETRNFYRLKSQLEFKSFQMEELRRENKRLTALLGLKSKIPGSVKKAIVARVIGKSMSPTSRVVLIDKGSKDGIKNNMLILSDLAVAGKIAEVYPTMSKALLINDSNSRIGALVQTTRHEGMLYGTAVGVCRMKYISMDAEVLPGQKIETAGFYNLSPKGLMIGRIEKVWKEPGRMYKVVDVRPLADLGRLEEVICVE